MRFSRKVTVFLDNTTVGAQALKNQFSSRECFVRSAAKSDHRFCLASIMRHGPVENVSMVANKSRTLYAPDRKPPMRQWQSHVQIVFFFYRSLWIMVIDVIVCNL